MSEHTYADRNQHLRGMGFATYADYLASPLWEGIRRRAYQYHGFKCKLCKKAKADSMHHISYSRVVLEGHDLSKLSPLCDPCHKMVEYNGDRKRTLVQAQTHYRRLKQQMSNKSGVLKPKQGRQLSEVKFCVLCSNFLPKTGECKVCIRKMGQLRYDQGTVLGKFKIREMWQKLPKVKKNPLSPAECERRKQAAIKKFYNRKLSARLADKLNKRV